MSSSSDLETQGTSGSVDMVHIASGAGVNFVGTVLRTIFSFGTTLLISHVLQVSQLGYYSLGTALAFVGLYACGFGLDMGLWRYISSYYAQRDFSKLRGAFFGSILISLPVGIIFAILLVLFAEPISRLVFSNNNFAFPLRMFAITIPLLLLARIFNAATQGFQIMRYAVFRDIIEQGLRFFLTAGLFLLGLRLGGALWANLIAVMVVTVISLYFLEKVYPMLTARKKIKMRLGETIKFSAPMGLSQVLAYLLLYMDTILLGYFGTAHQVGLYSVAVRVILIAATVQVAFSTMFAPVISELITRSRQGDLAELYTKVTRWTIMLSLPIFLPLMIFPSYVLKVFGPQFTVVSGSLIILTIGQLINILTGPVGVMIIMSGRSGLELFNNLLSWMISLAICVIFIPRLGIPGAAIANASAAASVNILRAIEVYLLMKVQPYSFNFLKLGVASLIACLLTLLGFNLVPIGSGIASVIVWTLVLITLYGASIILMGMDKDDSAMLSQFRAKLAKAKVAG